MSDEIQARMDAIAEEGKEYKRRLEGHKAAAETYHEYGMSEHAVMIEKTMESIEETLSLLKNEWHRLKEMKENMPY